MIEPSLPVWSGSTLVSALSLVVAWQLSSERWSWAAAEAGDQGTKLRDCSWVIREHCGVDEPADAEVVGVDEVVDSVVAKHIDAVDALQDFGIVAAAVAAAGGDDSAKLANAAVVACVEHHDDEADVGAERQRQREPGLGGRIGCGVAHGWGILRCPG